MCKATIAAQEPSFLTGNQAAELCNTILTLGEAPIPIESNGMTKDNLQIIANPGLRDGQRILELKGALTIHTVFGFQDAVKRENASELILDMSGVPYIDSAGLGAMVAAYVGAQKAMRKLAFAGMNTQVRALTDMTHVSQLFHSYPTVKDAEAALSKVE